MKLDFLKLSLKSLYFWYCLYILYMTLILPRGTVRLSEANLLCFLSDFSEEEEERERDGRERERKSGREKERKREREREREREKRRTKWISCRRASVA